MSGTFEPQRSVNAEGFAGEAAGPELRAPASLNGGVKGNTPWQLWPCYLSVFLALSWLKPFLNLQRLPVELLVF